MRWILTVIVLSIWLIICWKSFGWLRVLMSDAVSVQPGLRDRFVIRLIVSTVLAGVTLIALWGPAVELAPSMAGLAWALVGLGAPVAAYHFWATARPPLDRPAIYRRLGWIAHLIAWLIIGLALGGVTLLL